MPPYKLLVAPNINLLNEAKERLENNQEIDNTFSDDVPLLIEELKLHQIELELQNEELKRSRIELEALHREFADLYEFAPCGYLTLNAKGIITRANLAAVKLLGVDRESLLHSSLTLFIKDGWDGSYLSTRREAQESREKQNIALPLKEIDRKKPKWVLAEIDVEIDKESKMLGWRITLVDITERKEAQEKLEEFNQNLQERVEEELSKRVRIEDEKKRQDSILIEQSKKAAMGQMIGNIAHQWKQPLNAIGSIQTSIQAELLSKGEVPKKKLLKSVKASFEIIKHLSDTLDVFYQLLHTKECENSFYLLKRLEAIRKITEYTFANHNIELIYEFEIGSGHSLKGDGNEFLQALMNVILNAKEALDETHIQSPTITVSVCENENSCIITIADNAGGIKIYPIETIFDMEISSKDGSSGLGLFMAKNIIEGRFEGSIKATNSDDGAVFTIEVPLAK